MYNRPVIAFKISTTPLILTFCFSIFPSSVGSNYGNELPVDYYTATNGLQGMNVLNLKIIVKFLTFQLCIQLIAVSNYSPFSGFGQPMAALPPISAPQQQYMSGPGSPCDECK